MKNFHLVYDDVYKHKKENTKKIVDTNKPNIMKRTKNLIDKQGNSSLETYI